MSIRSHGRRPSYRSSKRPDGTATSERARDFDPFGLEISVFLETCEVINTPRSLACYLLVKNGEGRQYLELDELDKYSDTFADDYLVTEMLSKHPGIPGFTDADRKDTAYVKWVAAELKCKQTNERLLDGSWFEFLDPSCQRVLLQARAYIASLLGPLRKVDLQYAEASFRYGPGASSACKGRDVLPSRKMTSVLDVGPRLYPYWRSLIPFIGREALVHEINLVGYNSMTFVPKTAKTFRTISIEPHANIYVQLGIGSLLRSKLRRAGIDLDHQEEINRSCVRAAYYKNYATIDLSSASDTIASEVVRWLVPDDWFQLLAVARSEYTELPNGEITRLQKFSSMGNGYTFELETLIFKALAYGCSPSFSEVFGDDIIVPQGPPTELLLATLCCLGFSVNVKKTFTAGVFFESCGVDCHRGIDVRPFYLKGSYADKTTAVIEICNKISLYARRRNLNLSRDARFYRVWKLCLSHCNRAGRTGVGLGYGTAGLIKNFDEFCPARLKHGHEGYLGIVHRSCGVLTRNTSLLGAYALALRYSTGGDRSFQTETIRGSVTTIGLRSIPISQWVDPGPWADPVIGS